MTTEDAFQNALDAEPEAWHARLVFADWLDDRDDPRAEGYRAIAARRRRPFCILRPDGWACWWHREVFYRPAGNDIPPDWFARLPADAGSNLFWPQLVEGRASMSRRVCEDALALAFAQLPAARRAELLAPPADPGAGS